jgi:feruloyl esterase
MLDYYQRLRDGVGGLKAARKFARVFVVPGVYHCDNGYIPYEEDFLGTMVNWVEKDRVPQKVIASAVLSEGTERTRPVFAYPVQARYKGTGSINRASSFVGVMPAKTPDDHFNWLGAHMASGPPS